MSEPLVRAVGISRSYVSPGGVTHALKAASFSVDRDDLIALTGASGSGKTTLLHLMAGLDTPSEGDISWPLLGAREELRPAHITIAFQSPSLLPTLNVTENVALPLALGGVPELETAQMVTDILARMELTSLGDKLPEELSGGQSQRIALARALVIKPELVLADEPTGQQDREHADRLLDFLLQYAADIHMALVVATHDAAVAARFTTSWILTDGSLVTEGVV